MRPLIIPRKEHRISRKQMSPNAVRTLYRLHSNGFIAYLVGGCVRDLLLGRTPKDFDIATNARPGQIKRLFRNCRLVGRRFRLAHLHFQNEILEVSTFRRAADSSDVVVEDTEGTDRKPRRPWHLTDEDGMILVDNVFGTPEEDALRRDFTINALAYNIADFSVIDFSTGLRDLKEGIIRPIGDARVRFTEDPVRMLRAVRFAASHDFVIEPATWECLSQLAQTISRANPARLYEEILKLFLLGSARSAVNLLRESTLLAALFPWLERWITETSDHQAVMDRHLESLDRMHAGGEQPSLALFLAAVFGPGIEEKALALHRNGIPHQQALDQIFSEFIKETCPIVSIPGKIGVRLRAILGLQASLHRMPKRRPASVVNRPEFPESFAYLRLSAEGRKEYQTSLGWWEGFLSRGPCEINQEPPADQPVKPRRRRSKYRRRKKTAPKQE